MVIHIELINYDKINGIKSRIPDEFYEALLGELVSIFGINFRENITFDLCTSGGIAALFATCKKLDMLWLYEEWYRFLWYDSDILEERIESELSNIKTKDKYYKYVLNEMHNYNVSHFGGDSD